MRILMSHYNRFFLKKKKLSLILLNILTHFAFETKRNVPFDLQNSIPAPLKPHLEEALLHLTLWLEQGSLGTVGTRQKFWNNGVVTFPSASRFSSLSAVLPLVQDGLSRFHSPQSPFYFPKGAAFGEPDLQFVYNP